MKRSLLLFVSLWFAILLAMVIQKPLFMFLEPTYSLSDMGEVFSVIAHGFTMDLAMASYFMAPVVLWLIVRVWVGHKVMRRILNVYLCVVAALMAIAGVIDGVLYPYWGFRLDVTPLFYVTTSPAAALASLPWWGNLAVVVGCVVVSYGLYRWLLFVAGRFSGGIVFETRRRRVVATAVFAVIGGMMIIPIRGGVTVSTMSPGRAFFTSDMNLNNAAINPLFNFMYSLSHTDRLGSTFAYFDDGEARRIAGSLYERRNGVCVATEGGDVTDSVGCDSVSLRVARPDVYVIILESFSSHLLPTQGGEPIALCLDTIAREGVLFTNFYAESFRTDRALPAILSGYPSQPTTSLLRYVNKFKNIPSLATVLGAVGYETSYYYGGDIDFTNLKAYLVASGFEHIVSDVDFQLSQRLSKWGAHDDVVFGRALADVGVAGGKPRLCVIQTSSSHEPYDVPLSLLDDERANAFAYADRCLGDFVRGLRRCGAWDNALVVIVPDHWGSYPRDLRGFEERHHIPLVISGGALAARGVRVDRLGSQSGIAGTVSSLLGIDWRGAFVFSRDLLDVSTPEWAWMCEPTWFGLKTATGSAFIDVATGGVLQGSADGDDVARAKAFVQCVYSDLDRR